jgi:hypothetical protein
MVTVKSKRKRYQNDRHIDLEFTVENLSKAIFVVNKHAKTAVELKFLYELKKKALEKMLEEGKAKKLGLHFVRTPKFSIQSSTVLISCGAYLFHLPPKKEDFQKLKHLGHLNDDYRNPKTTNLSLNRAKALLIAYTGLKETKQTNPFFFQHLNSNIIITKSYRER